MNDDERVRSHLEASAAVYDVKERAFAHVKNALRAQQPLDELSLQAYILDELARKGLTTDGDKPIVAVNEHAATPHYFPSQETNAPIRPGDLLLIDLWARMPGGIYADITWMAFIGSQVPEEHEQRFNIICEAREAAITFLQASLKQGTPPRGVDVDEAARAVIRKAGYANQFIHNTGHSIDERVHGAGVNLRGYTEQEQRRVHRGLIFSIEPGIYLEGQAGYRTEINARIDEHDNVIISGPRQERITALIDSNI